MYINIETKEVVTRPDRNKMSFPVALSSEQLNSLGYAQLGIEEYPERKRGRVITEGTVNEVGGVYTRTWGIDDSGVDYTAFLRQDRDNRLSNSDWTQATDTTQTVTDKAAWATYRQELRDLPANTPDPENVTWPIAPNDGVTAPA
tara:strand:- start:98 stop:532 length:435 start_codon:yes stop_codon:yes gene_type:complete